MNNSPYQLSIMNSIKFKNAILGGLNAYVCMHVLLLHNNTYYTAIDNNELSEQASNKIQFIVNR